MSDLKLADIISRFKEMTEKECLYAIGIELLTLTERIDKHSMIREAEKQAYQKDKAELHNKYNHLTDHLSEKITPIEKRLTQLEAERGIVEKVATAGLSATMGAIAGWIAKHF